MVFEQIDVELVDEVIEALVKIVEGASTRA